ncbi:hypothetical protein [Thermoanaerobacterium sp. DL9XJH110]|uniref:hypothetical protein n=1 Tax=Thermoanaerobacterium sp. DL9XJH110 TaxID=3386643 RepID=UPI003BB60FE1
MKKGNVIIKTEECISKVKLLKREYMPDVVKIIEQKAFMSTEEEDEFYRPAIELLDFIYSQIQNKAS